MLKFLKAYLVIGSLAVCGSLIAQEQESDRIPFTLHPEGDKTDIYDLPVQTDEYDDKLQMEQLEKLSEKIQKEEGK